MVELLEHYMDTNQEHCRGNKPIVTGDARLRFFLVASNWHRSAVVLLCHGRQRQNGQLEVTLVWKKEHSR